MTSEHTTEDRLLELAQKFDSPEARGAYAQTLESTMSMQRDNLDMLDRSLSITRAVHGSEVKGLDIWIDIAKYLSPVFATAAITGLTVNSPNIQAASLSWIGIVGFVLSLSILTIILITRARITRRQKSQLEQLNRAFKGWQKVAEIQKKLSSKALGDMNTELRPVIEEIFQLQDLHEIKREEEKL